MINYLIAITSTNLTSIKNDRETRAFPLTNYFYNDISAAHQDTFDIAEACRTKTQGATVTKIATIYIDDSDVEEFTLALPPNAGSKVFFIIGAWHEDGTQLGLTKDDEGNYSGDVVWPLKLNEWIDDFSPHIYDGEGNLIKTARQHYIDTGLVQDVNLKVGQSPRDWVVR